MELSMGSLCMEVTRRCNMECPHCMRGEAQEKDITHEIIDLALRNVRTISSLVFTGGEVTLNVDAIRYTLEVCKRNDISVCSFYMVTNGKTIPDEFLVACIEWYSYCLDCNGGYDEDMWGVALSKDMFHEPPSFLAESRLKAFSFFRSQDKEVNWNKSTLLNLGRAREITGFSKRDKVFRDGLDLVYTNDDELLFEGDTVIAITVDGDILKDCDYEYDNTDIIKIGTVYDERWAERLIECKINAA